MRRLRILDEASEEAIEAAVWYEQQRPGLGREFGVALNAALDLLEEDIVPLTNLTGSVGARGVQRLAMGRFPYDIVVRVAGNEVVVIAIAHQSRQPGFWRRRLPR